MGTEKVGPKSSSLTEDIAKRERKKKLSISSGAIYFLLYVYAGGSSGIKPAQSAVEALGKWPQVATISVKMDVERLCQGALSKEHMPSADRYVSFAFHWATEETLNAAREDNTITQQMR